MQKCPKCGSTAPDDATQCSVCFAALGAAQPAPPAPPASGIPDAPPATTTAYSPMGADAPPQPFGAGVSVPREEEYMPIPGIPGVDNIPRDAPPVYGQPSSQSPIGLGGAPTRTTLAGDVIDDSAPTTYGHPGSGGPMAAGPPSGPTTMRPAGPTTSAPRRGSIHSRPAAMEGREPRGFPVVALVLSLLVLGGAGAGGWYWYNNRTNPKDQTVKMLQAFKALDYKEMYRLVALSPELQKEMPNAEAYEARSKQEIEGATPQQKQLIEMVLRGITDISAGEPTITGNTAVVPTSVTITMMGQNVKFKGQSKMIREGGIWKFDLTKAKNQAAADKAGQELIGQPDLSSLPGGGRGLPGIGGR